MLHKFCSIALLVGSLGVCAVAAAYSGPRTIGDEDLRSIVGAQDDCDVNPAGGSGLKEGPTCPVALGKTACTSHYNVCKDSKVGANTLLCQPGGGAASQPCKINLNCNAQNNDAVDDKCNSN